MTTVSNVYTSQPIELVRGGVATVRIRAKNSDGTLKDMTGKMVTFRAVGGGGPTITKTVSSFATVETVACGIDIAFTEADTRGILYPMTWEAEDEAHIVFAGGTLTAKGGANADA